MIASLDFLPEYKQEELKLITDLIVEKMKPAKLLLFGSYARNTWAEEEKVEEGIRLILWPAAMPMVLHWRKSKAPEQAISTCTASGKT